VPSFLIHTLGCKVNQLESEAITDAFLQAGYEYHESECETSPSVVIVNTCTVTSKADQKARRIIRKVLRDYPESKVMVTGCYARLNKEEISKLASAPSFSGRLIVTDGLGKDSLLKLNFPSSAPPVSQVFEFNPAKFSLHTRSFLKIQDGCDKCCTYCRIRLARGKSKSLEAAEVLSRLKILEKNHAEAVLTGVNISQYSDAGAGNIAELLDYLLAGTEKIAIRLSSLSPESVGTPLAKVISHERIRPHFHLSIQSCSQIILEKMGRAYSGETIEKAVSLLRQAKDDPFIACDIITGFPGETKTEFEETYNLCKKLDFAWIHVFPYSKRPGTPACNFPGVVQESEVTKRVRCFTDLAQEGRAAYIQRWLGREVDVLVEKANSPNICRGVSENYLKTLIRFTGELPPPGSVLRCKLIEHGTKNYDVTADDKRKEKTH